MLKSSFWITIKDVLISLLNFQKTLILKEVYWVYFLIFNNHQTYNLDKNIEEIFTGKCNVSNHKMELEYFCRTHNKLCCAACLSKIKDKENGKHHDCNVCLVEEIKEEK